MYVKCVHIYNMHIHNYECHLVHCKENTEVAIIMLHASIE